MLMRPLGLFEANLSRREIPSLYGLRGVAALTVVVYHALLEWNVLDFPGYYAVTLFFEISGLLITWLILTEIDRNGKLNKPQFYLRRSLRLFPVFYLMWTISRLAAPFAGSVAFFFYIGDYYTAITGNYSFFTSAWSLGVEEKFYLLWPQLVSRVRRAVLAKVLIAILIVEPVYRAVLHALGFRTYTNFAFDTTLDGIALGCLMAVGVKLGWRIPSWCLHPLAPLAAATLIVFGWRTQEIVIYCLALLLIFVIAKPPRLLNNAVARFFGDISYSLYLCHGYAFSVIYHWIVPASAKWAPLPGITLQLVLALAFAAMLHFAVERPFLTLKRRFHPRSMQ